MYNSNCKIEIELVIVIKSVFVNENSHILGSSLLGVSL